MRGWLAVALALSLTACVSGRTYRTQLHAPEGCIAQDALTCARDALVALPAADGTTRVQVGFVEFDDQGYLHRPDLKNALIEHIRATARMHPVLMVVFAHGWKHNADANDGNVRAFNDLVVKLAAADAALCANRPCRGRQVIGVYLGWRGLSTRVEPFKEMSFWNRKDKAHRVGEDGATEVIAELGKIKAFRLTRGRTHNRLVLLGHSFGGALVFDAVNQLLMRDLAYMVGGRLQRNTANLVVLVNPAFEAARFASLRRRSHDIPFQPGQRPAMAVFTSEADTATARAFPFGRTLNTLFSEYRKDIDQRGQDRTAIGHYDDFRTHTVTSTPEDPRGIAALDEIACDWNRFIEAETHAWRAGPVTLTRLANDGAQRFNPYIVARVEKGIVAGHNDIWGPVFTEFLYRLVAVQDDERCERRRDDAADDAADPQPEAE